MQPRTMPPHARDPDQFPSLNLGRHPNHVLIRDEADAGVEVAAESESEDDDEPTAADIAAAEAELDDESAEEEANAEAAAEEAYDYFKYENEEEDSAHWVSNTASQLRLTIVDFNPTYRRLISRQQWENQVYRLQVELYNFVKQTTEALRVNARVKVLELEDETILGRFMMLKWMVKAKAAGRWLALQPGQAAPPGPVRITMRVANRQINWGLVLGHFGSILAIILGEGEQGAGVPPAGGAAAAEPVVGGDPSTLAGIPYWDAGGGGAAGMDTTSGTPFAHFFR